MFGNKKVIVRTYRTNWAAHRVMSREMERYAGKGYQVRSTSTISGHRNLWFLLIPILWPFALGRSDDKVVVTYVLTPQQPQTPRAGTPVIGWPPQRPQ